MRDKITHSAKIDRKRVDRALPERRGRARVALPMLAVRALRIAIFQPRFKIGGDVVGVCHAAVGPVRSIAVAISINRCLARSISQSTVPPSAMLAAK